MHVVRQMTAPAVRFVKQHRDPLTVQTVRSAAAATLAYVIAVRLSPEAGPLTAPLTALLVVQVTLYSTLTTGLRRVNSVVTGNCGLPANTMGCSFEVPVGNETSGSGDNTKGSQVLPSRNRRMPFSTPFMEAVRKIGSCKAAESSGLEW